MAEPNPLMAQLADISEPPLQSGFELAPIWWLALTLLLCALVLLLWRLFRRWRFYAAKREALDDLRQLGAALKQNTPSVNTPSAAAINTSAAAINTLLKRVLQHYQPAHPVLSQPETVWQHWLSSQVPAPLPDLNQLIYARHADNDAVVQFYQFAGLWLKQYKAKAPQAVPKTTTETGVQHA